MKGWRMTGTLLDCLSIWQLSDEPTGEVFNATAVNVNGYKSLKGGNFVSYFMYI